jgi:hypothetical protein
MSQARAALFATRRRAAAGFIAGLIAALIAPAPAAANPRAKPRPVTANGPPGAATAGPPGATPDAPPGAAPETTPGATPDSAIDPSGTPPGADPGDAIDPSGSRDRIGSRRERLRRRVREARADYLSHQLRLDERTARRLFTLLDRFDGRLDDLHRRGVQLRRALRRENASARPDNAALEQLIDELLAHYEDLYQVQRARLVAVRRVVTPAQTAKLVVLLPQLDEAIRKQIQRALRERGKSAGDVDEDFWPRPRRRRGHRPAGDPPPNAPPFTDPF